MTKSLEEKLFQYFPFIKDYPKPSVKEREEFKSILKPISSHFKGITDTDLAQVLKVVESHLSSLKEAEEAELMKKEKAEARKAYHQGIIALKQSLKCLYEEDLEEVIFKFKGSKLNPKRNRQGFTIPIKGLPTEILKKILLPFYSESLDSQEKKALRNIIPEYVEAYESFHIEYKVLHSKAPLAKERKKIIESSKGKGFDNNKYLVSFRLSEFFKNHLAYSSKADIPEFIPVFLKEYFLLIRLEKNPEITSNTFKGWINKGKALKY